MVKNSLKRDLIGEKQSTKLTIKHNIVEINHDLGPLLSALIFNIFVSHTQLVQLNELIRESSWIYQFCFIQASPISK